MFSKLGLAVLAAFAARGLALTENSIITDTINSTNNSFTSGSRSSPGNLNSKVNLSMVLSGELTDIQLNYTATEEENKTFGFFRELEQNIVADMYGQDPKVCSSDPVVYARKERLLQNRRKQRHHLHLPLQVPLLHLHHPRPAQGRLRLLHVGAQKLRFEGAGQRTHGHRQEVPRPADGHLHLCRLPLPPDVRRLHEHDLHRVFQQVHVLHHWHQTQVAQHRAAQPDERSERSDS